MPDFKYDEPDFAVAEHFVPVEQFGFAPRRLSSAGRSRRRKADAEAPDVAARDIREEEGLIPCSAPRHACRSVLRATVGAVQDP